MKKRIISLLLTATLATTVFAMSGCKKNETTTDTVVNVYNWGEYISDGSEGTYNVNKEFEKATGIKVNYQLYQTNEELYAMMKMGSADIDVIIPSDYMIGKMVNENMLAKLDFSNIPNYQYIDETLKKPEYDPNDEYTVPYTWGTVGIFYNKTMVDEEDVKDISWDLLWNEKYAGKILMFDNPRDSFAIAESLLGFSLNTTDKSELDQCAELLKKQSSVLQGRVMDQIFDKMINGEAAIGPYYAGDGIVMMEENEDIEFGIPKEGRNKFVDAMCIPAKSKNKTAAEKYINFMCETKTALANAETIGYSTPQTEAKKELDPEIANSPVFYPGVEQLKNTEIFLTLPDDVDKYMNELWIDIKK